MSKETSISGRNIKTAIEKMIVDGLEKMAIVKRVIDMGVEATMAEFMVNLYSRKFNK